MRAVIKKNTIVDVEYQPHYKGKMNRFKVTLKEKEETATVYLFSYRDGSKTKRLNSILKVDNCISAELTIVQDPKFSGERNIAMITKILEFFTPKSEEPLQQQQLAI